MGVDITLTSIILAGLLGYAVGRGHGPLMFRVATFPFTLLCKRA